MRNYFVGLLFAVGTAMFLMRGYGHWENAAVNLSGVAAIGVALFPMAWTGREGDVNRMHGISAIVFFACLTFVCAFCSDNTLRFVTDPAKKKIYKAWYVFWAAGMFLSPITSLIVNNVYGQGSRTFWLESLGSFSFAGYWVTKTFELEHSGAEKRAVKGEIDLYPKPLFKKPGEESPKPVSEPNIGGKRDA